MGFKDDDEFDLSDLSARAGANAVPPSKPEDYGTETNMFAVEFDVSERNYANPAKAAPPPAPARPSAFADDEDEFDLSGAASGSAYIDDDDDEFPAENEGFFSKIKAMFAKPRVDDDDIDLDIDLDDASDDFSDIVEFPDEKEGFFSKIKGMFAKPDVDDGDIDTGVDLDDAVGDFSGGDDDFPEEKEGFFSKIKGMFSKPADIDDFDDDLLDDDDYTPVLDKGGDSGVFDLSFSAAPRAEPEFEAAEPEFEEFEAVRADFEAAEPEFEAVKAEFEAFGTKPQFSAGGAAASFEEDGDEFDLSASVPPPPPVRAPLPPPVFNRIAHVCLNVKDLDASIDFYTKLGFTKCFAFTKNGGLFGAYLEFGGGNFIELFKDTHRGAGAARGRLAHFCLETPDINATIESLSSRGIEHTPKKLGSDHTYQIWLKDPDGNDFEIHQYTRESSQITGKDVEADW